MSPRYLSPAERAANGATLLDQRVPGWHWRIDPARLEISSCASCVMGQLYGEYHHGIRELHCIEPVAHGFHPRASHSVAVMEEDCRQLTAAWRDEIAKRRTLPPLPLELVEQLEREMMASRFAEMAASLAKTAGSAPGPKARAIVAVALDPSCNRLREEECSAEWLWDVAVLVVDTAASSVVGLSLDEIRRDPELAVQRVREAWQQKPGERHYGEA